LQLSGRKAPIGQPDLAAGAYRWDHCTQRPNLRCLRHLGHAEPLAREAHMAQPASYAQRNDRQCHPWTSNRLGNREVFSQKARCAGRSQVRRERRVQTQHFRQVVARIEPARLVTRETLEERGNKAFRGKFDGEILPDAPKASAEQNVHSGSRSDGHMTAVPRRLWRSAALNKILVGNGR